MTGSEYPSLDHLNRIRSEIILSISQCLKGKYQMCKVTHFLCVFCVGARPYKSRGHFMVWCFLLNIL